MNVDGDVVDGGNLGDVVARQIERLQLVEIEEHSLAHLADVVVGEVEALDGREFRKLPDESRHVSVGDDERVELLQLIEAVDVELALRRVDDVNVAEAGHVHARNGLRDVGDVAAHD